MQNILPPPTEGFFTPLQSMSLWRMTYNFTYMHIQYKSNTLKYTYTVHGQMEMHDDRLWGRELFPHPIKRLLLFLQHLKWPPFLADRKAWCLRRCWPLHLLQAGLWCRVLNIIFLSKQKGFDFLKADFCLDLCFYSKNICTFSYKETQWCDVVLRWCLITVSKSKRDDDDAKFKEKGIWILVIFVKRDLIIK